MNRNIAFGTSVIVTVSGVFSLGSSINASASEEFLNSKLLKSISSAVKKSEKTVFDKDEFWNELVDYTSIKEEKEKDAKQKERRNIYKGLLKKKGLYFIIRLREFARGALSSMDPKSAKWRKASALKDDLDFILSGDISNDLFDFFKSKCFEEKFNNIFSEMPSLISKNRVFDVIRATSHKDLAYDKNSNPQKNDFIKYMPAVNFLYDEYFKELRLNEKLNFLRVHSAFKTIALIHNFLKGEHFFSTLQEKKDAFVATLYYAEELLKCEVFSLADINKMLEKLEQESTEQESTDPGISLIMEKVRISNGQNLISSSNLDYIYELSRNHYIVNGLVNPQDVSTMGNNFFSIGGNGYSALEYSLSSQGTTREREPDVKSLFEIFNNAFFKEHKSWV